MYLNLSLPLHRLTSPTHHGKAVFMSLYSFQKSLLDLVRILNVHNYSFRFGSVGSCHYMFVPCAYRSWQYYRVLRWLDACHPYYEYKNGSFYIV